MESGRTETVVPLPSLRDLASSGEFLTPLFYLEVFPCTFFSSGKGESIVLCGLEILECIGWGEFHDQNQSLFCYVRGKMLRRKEKRKRRRKTLNNFTVALEMAIQASSSSSQKLKKYSDSSH
ncbi:hypothetical protein HC762_01410 [bacterium]|nr:hypothetical protein [bacterium]